MAELFDTPEQVADYIHDLLTLRGPEVGIKYVAYGDETLLPEYPAVVVVPVDKQKTLHATQTFNIEFEVHLFVMHAALSQSHQQRTREDLQLVTAIEGILEEGTGYTLKDDAGDEQIIFGYVQREAPGFANRERGTAIVGTRMVWVGLSQRRFNGPVS